MQKMTVKGGKLTDYALSCGYREKYSLVVPGKADIVLTLEKLHGCYHVVSYCHARQITLYRNATSRLNQAREWYDGHIRAYRQVYGID